MDFWKRSWTSPWCGRGDFWGVSELWRAEWFLQINGSVWTLVGRFGLLWAGLDFWKRIWTSLGRFGLLEEDMDFCGQVWTFGRRYGLLQGIWRDWWDGKEPSRGGWALWVVRVLGRLGSFCLCDLMDRIFRVGSLLFVAIQ